MHISDTKLENQLRELTVDQAITAGGETLFGE